MIDGAAAAASAMEPPFCGGWGYSSSSDAKATFCCCYDWSVLDGNVTFSVLLWFIPNSDGKATFSSGYDMEE
ncbi:hypothetical protein V6N13_137722 [Hibiscus sabdariffa]|uniref:Uncharacterized protein n=1 Tax=Hibiscus sabdariffa TaxID=183260 RepID=A0ABR2DKX4_9ROSI